MRGSLMCGRAGAAVALTILTIGAAQAAIGADPVPTRLYDREADCAVFDIAGASTARVSWDGPCKRGLASGRGIAIYYEKGGASRTVAADFRAGVVGDGQAEIRWSDGARYSGKAAGGAPNGPGVLIDAQGNRFQGEWKEGALNGHGSVAWTNGDRYEGEWLGGKAEGHGVQVWAGGQKYDGLWHNDLPNGQGIVTHKDGTQYSGLFVDGKRQAAPDAATAPATAQQLFEVFSGKTLMAADGSTVTLAANDGGVLRTVMAADGSVQKAAFAYLGNGLGTVSDAVDPPQVNGFFRISAAGIEISYADGHSEVLARDGDGLTVTLKATTGEQSCAAWYPRGHVFSIEQRRAAVAAYARRLGVTDVTDPPRASCLTQASVASTTPVAAPPAASPHRSANRPGRANMPPAPAARPATTVSGLQTVPVKDSTVHLIDAPMAPAAHAPPPMDEEVASKCLKVDSDGSYWGFRNHCGYAVQFAYCLLHGVEQLTACDGDGVPGSVSAHGFGALFNDTSLTGRGTEHDFRWVGCRGGAGEVTAHLDSAEPASGRCIRAATTVARDN